MRLNPSLTARLRIGFVILFALLLVVSLLGVGRLFQIRVDFEDETDALLPARARDRAGAIGVRPRAGGDPPARAGPAARPRRARAAPSQSFEAAADRAAEQTGDDPVLSGRLERLVADEAAWRQSGRAAPGARARHRRRGAAATADRRRSPSAPTSSAIAVHAAREQVRDDARDDTRDTTIFVIAGLARRPARRADPLLRPDQLDARAARQAGRRRPAPRGRRPGDPGRGRRARSRSRRSARHSTRWRPRSRRDAARAGPHRADEGRLRAHGLARAAHPGHGRQGLRRDAHGRAQGAERAPVRGGRRSSPTAPASSRR